MTTLTAEMIEFRCNRCWQSNYVPVSEAGTSVNCQSCEAEVLVPEATPERLRSADEVAFPDAKPIAKVAPEYKAGLSDSELMQIVREQNDLPLSEMDFSGYPPASIGLRFLAFVIDVLFVALSFGLGTAAVLVAGNLGYLDLTDRNLQRDQFIAFSAVFYFFPLVGFIIQWNLIATRGQTIGKMATFMRIVTVQGRLPGFFWGVVMRNWVRNLLCMIPLFGFIDLIAIFFGQNRCLHDYLATTRVVQV